jgi:hypothetical protein
MSCFNHRLIPKRMNIKGKILLEDFTKKEQTLEVMVKHRRIMFDANKMK